jgi:hypothetical protein
MSEGFDWHAIQTLISSTLIGNPNLQGKEHVPLVVIVKSCMCLSHVTWCLQMDNIIALDPLGEWDACKNDATSCTKDQFAAIQGSIWLSACVWLVALWQLSYDDKLFGDHLPQTETGYCWFEMLCGKSHIVDCSRADYVAWLCIVISYMDRLNKHAPGIHWQGAEQSYWRQSSLFKTARRMACLLMDASIIVKHLVVYSGMGHRHLE